MKRKLIIPILSILAVTLFLVSTLPGDSTAQQQGTRIAFVNTDAVLEAHPAGQQAATLQRQAQEELNSIRQELEPLLQRRNAGETLATDERETLDVLQRTYQQTQQRYTQEIQEAVRPAEEAVDNAIRAVAQEQGYTMVLNRAVAATSGLVVYAEDDLDITEQVVARLQ